MEAVLQRPSVVDDIMSRISGNYVSTYGREGIHLTDTIYCLRKAYWNQTNSLPPTPDEVLYFLLGLGLQEVFLGGDNQTLAERDGIAISPDFWEQGILGELKTTRIGQKRLLAYDFPSGWIQQLMGYAKVMEVKQALLIVIPIIKPDVLSFVLTFTQEELDYNWGDRVHRAKLLEQAFSSKKLPVPFNQQWECDSCRYNLRCKVL